MKRRDDDSIGWCPPAERSMIASRRLVKPIPAAGSDHIPQSSGPRWTRVSPIARSKSHQSSRLTPGCQTPAMPHIGAVFFLRSHADGGEERRHAMAVGVLGDDMLVRLLHDGPPLLFVLEAPHDVVDVGQIFAQTEVVLVGLQDAVIAPFEENLACSSPDRLEVSRRDRLAGYWCRNVPEESGVHFWERGGRMLAL